MSKDHYPICSYVAISDDDDYDDEEEEEENCPSSDDATVQRSRAATAPVRPIRLCWSNVTATAPAKSVGCLDRRNRSKKVRPQKRKTIVDDGKCK